MKRFRHLVPFFLGIAAISCTSQSEFSDPDLAFTTSLISAKTSIATPYPHVFLIVADDADTLDAAQLRERMPNALHQRLLHETPGHSGVCENGDPARWHQSDVRIVLARPSAPDGEALLSSVDIPNLEWITNTSKEEEIDPIAAAMTEALGKRLAKPGEPYRPLRTAGRAVDLISFAGRIGAMSSVY